MQWCSLSSIFSLSSGWIIMLKTLTLIFIEPMFNDEISGDEILKLNRWLNLFQCEIRESSIIIFDLFNLFLESFSLIEVTNQDLFRF
jgi:hypothetical protein